MTRDRGNTRNTSLFSHKTVMLAPSSPMIAATDVPEFAYRYKEVFLSDRCASLTKKKEKRIRFMKNSCQRDQLVQEGHE